MGLCSIAKSFVLVVLVDGEHFVVDVGDEQILPAVAVEVGGVYAHARARLAALAEAHSRLQGDFLPFPACRRGRATIHEQKVLHGVVCDKQIHPAIVIDVGRYHAQTLAERLGDIGALADLGEGAISIVVVEEVCGRTEDTGNAVVLLADFVVATLELVLARVVDEAADEQVEPAVIVVVEPDGARGPPGVATPAFSVTSAKVPS